MEDTKKIVYGSFSLEDLGISEEAFEKEMACYCDCDEPDEHPEYVESAYIEGVGQVNHHGWLCRKCKKYVQIG